MSEKSQSLVISKREIWLCVRHVAPCNSKMAVDTPITRCRWFNNTFPAIEAHENQFSAYEIWPPILSSRRAPRRYQKRRRIIPGLRPTLDSSCFSRAFVPAVEPITWSFYASLPRNPCSRSPLPETGDLPRAQTTRKSAHALWRPGNSGREGIRPIQTGIRESGFSATVGIQLLGDLNPFWMRPGLRGWAKCCCRRHEWPTVA
jgi:hypothetical protein